MKELMENNAVSGRGPANPEYRRVENRLDNEIAREEAFGCLEKK